MKKIIPAILIPMFLFACNKDKKENTQDIMQTANDQAIADNEFASVFETADNVLREDPTIKDANDFLPDCAVLEKDTVNKTITINYGTVNCLCNDGLYRRGMIKITHTGKYRTLGAVITINLIDYYVNDNLYTGTKTIENLGTQTGNFRYNYTVTDASITFTDGTIRKWSKNAIIERTEGEGTITPWDDVYLVTGSSSGTNRKGREYNAVTTVALKKKMQIGCARNFVGGVITVTDTEQNTLVINYDPIGGEPCDKVAEVTINGGEPKRITLR